VDALLVEGASGSMQSVDAAPPWLRRQEDARRLVETVARLKRIHVYEAEEIIRVVGERYRRLRPRRPGKRGRIEFELKRLETVFNVAYTRLLKAAEMPPASKMSVFHRALIDAFIGVDEYEAARRAVRRGLSLMRDFWNQYRWLIATAESPQEAARLRKEGSGRILSVVRRLAPKLRLLRRVRDELVHTHVVAEGLPVAVVAGIPSAGKSTLVAALSTARPETAAYPFTTKTIIVGKVEDTVSYYIVDTPGVLERPPEHQNVIERKALAALSALPDIVLYLFDPSTERVQDIDDQVKLLESILRGFAEKRDAKVIVAVNKADAADPEAEARILDALGRISHPRLCGNPLRISALRGQGLQELRKSLERCVREKAPWLFEKKLTLSHSSGGKDRGHEA